MVAGAGAVVEVYPENVIGLQQYITNITYPKDYITSNYYNSTYVQARLNEKAFTSGVYTKTEVDTKVNDKAFTSGVYTKSQVDAKFSSFGTDLFLPLSTYNADIKLINTSLTNMQQDLDGKLSKTKVYDIGEVNSELLVDGKRGDYQICTLVEDSIVSIGQTSFFNFETGDGVVIEINKPYAGVLSLEGKIILTTEAIGTFLIGVFMNGTKYVVTAPTQIIN